MQTLEEESDSTRKSLPIAWSCAVPPHHTPKWSNQWRAHMHWPQVARDGQQRGSMWPIAHFIWCPYLCNCFGVWGWMDTFSWLEFSVVSVEVYSSHASPKVNKTLKDGWAFLFPGSGTCGASLKIPPPFQLISFVSEGDGIFGGNSSCSLHPLLVKRVAVEVY